MFPVAGVDVGGPSKGYHVVGLREDGLHTSQGRTAEEVIEWLTDFGAKVVAVDAPCRWSATGRARPVEKELMGEGVWCFSTPTREAAVNHPKNHYGWMLAGEKVYRLAESRWGLFDGSVRTGYTMIETFPHAIAWAIAGQIVSAKGKSKARRAVLESVGIPTARLRNIDFVDAALCAVTAQSFAQGQARWYGEKETGFIVVPARKG